MLSKCIGIISGFPDDHRREVRKNRFLSLLNVLNTYFKLPIVIIAQNGREEDCKLDYCNEIKIYSYKNALGITKARATLRDKLLEEDYDYFIFLDDDANIICNEQSVQAYFDLIDRNPNKVGKFKSWLRLYAISKHMLIKMNGDFIANKEAAKGELWEDICGRVTGEKIYPSAFYTISISGLDEVSIMSNKDSYSTGCTNNQMNNLGLQTKRISEDGVKYESMHRNNIKY